MTYRFEITIKPVVNFCTNNAELCITDQDYNGKCGGEVVRQKHISRHSTTEETEQAAEAFCAKLHKELCDIAKQRVAHLSNAKP